jgi:hypothetical protein
VHKDLAGEITGRTAQKRSRKSISENPGQVAGIFL